MKWNHCFDYVELWPGGSDSTEGVILTSVFSTDPTHI